LNAMKKEIFTYQMNLKTFLLIIFINVLIVMGRKTTILSDFASPYLNSFRKTGTSFILLETPTEIVLCSSEEDMMHVEKVYIVPDPPTKGANLSVFLQGTLYETLDNGAYMTANVKKGGIKFPQVRFSVCDYMKNGGCPVAPGEQTLQFEFDIPKMIPGGPYEVQANLFNADVSIAAGGGMTRYIKHINQIDVLMTGNRLACVQGTVYL
jgi:hypothetical protein